MTTIDPTEAANLDGLSAVVGGIADELGQHASGLDDTVNALAERHVSSVITDNLSSVADALTTAITHTRLAAEQIAKYFDAIDTMGGPDAVPTREFLTGQA